MSQAAPSRDAARRRRRRRPVLLALALLVVVLAALAVWGVQEVRAATQASRQAERSLREATRALDAGDLEQASDHAEEASGALRQARRHAAALPLTLLQPLPVVGEDVRAARTTVAAADDAVADGVLPVVDGALALVAAQQAAPSGQVDVAAVTEFAAVVHEAAEVTAAGRERVEALAPEDLLWAAEPVGSAVDGLVELDEQVSGADAAMAAAVPALGADGPRTYLLAAQNLAEARPTGGLIGSWALLTVDQGRIALADVGVNDDLASLTGKLPDLPDDVEALYGQDLALSQNINLSPDFPLAASLLVDLWTAQGRPAPDGVVGMDPVALARVLGATGPVQPPTGPELDRKNLVRIVQQEVYRTYDGRTRERQAYLGTVTGAVFQALVGADWSDADLRRSLTNSLEDGHVQLWSADPATQQTLVDLGVSGTLGPPPQDGGTARVHLTNLDGSKLDQFLEVTVSAGCAVDGAQVVVGLTSTPPPKLPRYSESHLDGLAPRDHRLLVALYLPPTRGLSGLEVDGASRSVSAGTEQGWTVVRATVDVPDGGTVQLTWNLSGDSRPPAVHVQPMTRDATVTATAPGAGCA